VSRFFLQRQCDFGCDLARKLNGAVQQDSSMEIVMKRLVLIAVMAAPPLIGSIAVGNTEGSANFLMVLFFSFLMFRESLKICLILMRRWRMIEQVPQFGLFAPLWDEEQLQPVRIRKQRNIYRRDIYNRW
jgi:hypothetical protein